jgi:hypothetical protein
VYRDRRHRPGLTLTATTATKFSETDEGFAQVTLLLTNDGPGRAANWGVMITSPVPRRLLLDSNAGPPIDATNEYDHGTDSRIEWQTRGPADAIGEHRTRQLACITDQFPMTDVLIADYLISADRMDDRSGEIRVSWDYGVASVEVTS